LEKKKTTGARARSFSSTCRRTATGAPARTLTDAEKEPRKKPQPRPLPFPRLLPYPRPPPHLMQVPLPRWTLLLLSPSLLLEMRHGVSSAPSKMLSLLL